jgi:DNA-binding ferritin-like protein (Dps family)
VTEDNTEQRTITDSLRDVSGASEAESGQKQQQPSPKDPHEFLLWLRNEDRTSSKQVIKQLPFLIEQVREGGYEARPAGQCINHLLERESAEDQIKTPKLLTILGSQHVDTLLLIKHLKKTYPRNIVTLDVSIDLDFLESDQLSHSERMEGYRALSRMPPDDRIYRKLREISEMFDGVVKVGKRYPVGGFLQTYAMRCLTLALQNPDQSQQRCARQAIMNHTKSALRVVAAQPERAVQTDLLDDLINALKRTPIPDGFCHGRIIATLCEEYIQTESQATQRQIGKLIQVTLSAGVLPTHWDKTVPRLIDWLEQSGHNKEAGTVLAAIIDAAEDAIVDETLIEEIIGKLRDGDPALWVDSVGVFAEVCPEKVAEYADILVTIARSGDGDVRAGLCETLGTVASIKPEVVLPVMGPLIEDLERSTTVRELEDIGSILQSADVYPPPTQLTNLYGSTNEAIDRKAKKIVSNLRQQFRNKKPILVPGGPDSVQDLSDDYSLVQRAGPVTWKSPSLGGSELSIINSVVQISRAAAQGGSIPDATEELFDKPLGEFNGTNDSIQFLAPSYDSRWVEFAVLGAVFAQLVNPDIRVVLHTPATGGWGTKKDIKETLRKYALASNDNHTDLVPLLDLVPTARISGEDTVIETRGTTVTDDPPHITLVRDIDPLAEASADVILYNYLPGIDAANAAQLQKWRGTPAAKALDEVQPDKAESADGAGMVAERSTLKKLVQIDDADFVEATTEHPADPFHIEIYSIFTAQYASNRRQHIGPPTDLSLPALIGKNTGTAKSGTDVEYGEASELLADRSRVELHKVQSDQGIGELLATIEEYSNRVSDPEIAQALQRFRYTVGGLPVPVELHDTWIQNQIDQGNKWVPRRIHVRQKGIKALIEEAGFDAQILDEAVITIETLLDRLAETNPLFDELLTVLDDAALDEKQVGILCGKKTYKDMLDTYLNDQANDWVLGDDLLLLDENTVRELDPGDVDWIVTFGPLPPQTAIYYHHPAVENTVVLGHADGTLESRVYGVESKRRPFLPERITADLPELEITTHGNTLDMAETSEDLTDDLYRTFLSVAARSSSDDGRQPASSGQLTRYRLEFEEIEGTVLSDAHPQVVRSEDHLVSTGEYVLRSLSRIAGGDEMVLIEGETRNDLWEEFLREDWEENDEAVDAEETFMDAVDLWYEAISAGLEAQSDSSDPSDGIGAFAREIEPETSVDTDAIKDWARGVYRADSPSDLVFRSELRIGPQNADGVKAVAEAFGSERMVNNWKQVFTRIKAIRATHRKRGGVFWQWLADRACDGELFNRPGVSSVTVTQCKKTG